MVDTDKLEVVHTAVTDSYVVSIKAKDREEAEKIRTELRQNVKKATNWTDFSKYMSGIEIFNPTVFKHWKDVMIKIDERIEELQKELDSIGTDLTVGGAQSSELEQRIYELKKLKETENESQTQVPSVQNKVQLQR